MFLEIGDEISHVRREVHSACVTEYVDAQLQVWRLCGNGVGRCLRGGGLDETRSEKSDGEEAQEAFHGLDDIPRFDERQRRAYNLPLPGYQFNAVRKRRYFHARRNDQ